MPENEDISTEEMEARLAHLTAAATEYANLIEATQSILGEVKDEAAVLLAALEQKGFKTGDGSFCQIDGSLSTIWDTAKLDALYKFLLDGGKSTLLSLLTACKKEQYKSGYTRFTRNHAK